MPRGTEELYRRDAIRTAGSVNGARLFQEYRYSHAKKETTFDHFLITESGVLLFDLEKGDMAALQDQVLSDFVAENAALRECDGEPSILYPYRDGVYILTHSGLYWHKLYGESIEQVIDGSFCTMNNGRRIFTGMALIETGAEPEFLILYDGKYLMRYTYDAALPAVPEGPQALRQPGQGIHLSPVPEQGKHSVLYSK